MEIYNVKGAQDIVVWKWTHSHTVNYTFSYRELAFKCMYFAMDFSRIISMLQANIFVDLKVQLRYNDH